MTRLDLQPFFRSIIGFDEIAEMLDDISDAGRKPNQYPPYNVEKIGEESYQITVAVAGFEEDDLDITKHNNLLTLEGRMANKKANGSHDPSSSTKERVFLYKGIAERSFQLQFRLADHMVIEAVNLSNGMLTISMERHVPEALKPQKIAINQSKSSGKNNLVIENKTS